MRRPAQMTLQHLPQVHPRRHANGVEDDVHGRAVGQERHILLRQDAGHHALVAVPPRHLVAHGDFARLRHPHPDGFVHIRRQIVLVIPAELLDPDDLAPLPVRHPQRSIPHILGLFAENGPQQPLLGRHLRFAFGRNLAHQNVVLPHLRANPHNPPFVQIPQVHLAHIGNVAGNLLRAQLRGAAVHFVLLNMHRSELVILHQPLADDDGVLVVVALPRHKGHQHILPQRQLPAVGGRAVRQRIAHIHIVALLHHRTLVETRSLIGAAELDERVRMFLAGLVHDDDLLSVHGEDGTRHARQQHLPAVPRHPALNPRAYNGRLRLQQRHRLPLHIAAHQRPVGVVMLQERDQRRRHAHNLQRRHIHILHRRRGRHPVIVPFPHFHQLVGELVPRVKPGVGLGNAMLLLPVGGKVMDAFRPDVHKRNHINHRVRRELPQLPPVLRGNGLARRHNQPSPAGFHIRSHRMPHRIVVAGQPRRAAVAQPQLLHHRPVGRLNKPQPVNARVGRQAAQQPDVRPLRRLNGADASVVRGVDVPHIKAGPFPGQPAPAQGGKTPLVRQLRQRVRLVHKLRKFVAPEKLADGPRYGPHIHQFRRHRILRLFQPPHPVLEHPVHPQHANPHLVPYQLPRHPHPAVAQMVNVVLRLLVGGVLPDQLLQGVNDVVPLQRPAFRQRRSRQVETHLVHIPVGAGVHLRNHAHNVRRPRPHRRQPPGLRHPLAYPLRVNQLPRLHDAVPAQKAVFQHGHFPAGYGILRNDARKDRLRGNGHGFPQRVGDFPLHADHNRIAAVPLHPRQQGSGAGRIRAGHADGNGRSRPLVPRRQAGKQIQRLHPPVGVGRQVSISNQRVHIPVRQDAMLPARSPENLRARNPRSRFGVPFPDELQRRLLLLGKPLRPGAPQPLVNLDAAHFPQIKPASVKKVVQHKPAGGVHLHRRFPRPQPLVEVALRQPDELRLLVIKLPVGMQAIPQGLQFLNLGVVIPVLRRRRARHERPAVIRRQLLKKSPHFLGADNAQRVKKSGNPDPAPAIHADAHRLRQVPAAGVVVRPGGQLNPRPPAGRNPRPVVPVLQPAALRAGRILRRFPLVIHARRPLQLAHQHPLRPVDDESPGLRHHRHIAKENVRLGHLPRLLVAQLRLDIQRTRVGNLPFPALLRAEQRRVKPVILKIQLVALGPAGRLATGEPPGDARHDGRALPENLRQPLGREPLKGFLLAPQQVGNVQRVGDVRIGVSLDLAGGQPAVVVA